MKPRPLVWSLVWLPVPFIKMGNSEEEQDLGGGGGGAECVGWKYPRGNVQLAVKYKGLEPGGVNLEVTVHFYVLINKYLLSVCDRLGWGCSGE